MKYRQTNKFWIHVNACSFLEFMNARRTIQLSSDLKGNGLLLGIIQQQPITDDEDTNNALPIGTKVLIQAYDDQGRTFVEAIDGQPIMELGDYVVKPYAILGIVEITDENTPIPDTTPPLPGCADDDDYTMGDHLFGSRSETQPDHVSEITA